MSSITVAGLFQAFKDYASTHQLQVLLGTAALVVMTRAIVRYVFVPHQIDSLNAASATRGLTGKYTAFWEVNL